MSRAGGRDRGYPTAEVYEERERDFYGSGRRPYVQQYEELDAEISTGQRLPDFMHDTYGRTNAGPLVMRERGPLPRSPPSNEPTRASRSRREMQTPRGYGQDYEVEEQLLVRHKSKRNKNRDDGSSDGASNNGRAPTGRNGRKEEIDINIEDDRRSRGARREDIEVDIRQQQYGREQSRNRRDDFNEEITFRRGGAGPPREEVIYKSIEAEPPRRARGGRDFDEEIEVDVRREPRSRGGDLDEVDVNIRRNARSQSRPRVIAREREEFYYKRREPSPPPQREIEQITIRRPRTRTPSPSSESEPEPEPSPEPEPEPKPIRQPPIIQEIITHHRHIDHGVVRAPPSVVSSSSSSPSPPPVKRRPRELEIDIRRKDARGNTFEEDIRIIDDARSERVTPKPREAPRETQSRKSSRPEPAPPAPRRVREETNINIDLDLSGGGQITKSRPRDRWTEVTKDLVIKEAIERRGYTFEETDEFFYIMEYLEFDDVADLVDLSATIRDKRRERLEQIQWERQDPRLARVRSPPSNWDERVYEREVIYDTRPARRH